MTDDAPIGSTVADQSLQIATALSAEVIVLRERLEIVERLAEAHGLFGTAQIDGFRLDAATAENFKAKRKAFLGRVFGAMRTTDEGRR